MPAGIWIFWLVPGRTPVRAVALTLRVPRPVLSATISTSWVLATVFPSALALLGVVSEAGLTDFYVMVSSMTNSSYAVKTEQ